MIEVVTEYWTYKDCLIDLNRYVVDDSLCIKLYNYTDGPVATLTKCLNDKGLPARQQYVDVNNCPWAMDLIKKYHLGEPTGEEGRSGYCVYPIVEFDIEELKKHMIGVMD